jgi:hypothetical protein
MARMAVLLAGLPNTVGGVTINRYCASGMTAVAMAADRIRVGEADVMIAAGAESMSMVPMMGHHPSINPKALLEDENIGIAYGMGLTAEKVAAAVEGFARGAGRVCGRIASAARSPRSRPVISTTRSRLSKSSSAPEPGHRRDHHRATRPSAWTKVRARTRRSNRWPS